MYTEHGKVGFFSLKNNFFELFCSWEMFLGTINTQSKNWYHWKDAVANKQITSKFVHLQTSHSELK